MGAKAGLEYEIRNVRLKGEHYGPSPAVAKALNDMAADGWSLVSCSHPHEKWALMAFSRPRRAASGGGSPIPEAAVPVDEARGRGPEP
jgi:hypothetical protein